MAEHKLQAAQPKLSILLHRGLNPAWHFWLSTRFSCCLKMKSVENILGYVREQFYRFSRGCKPRENIFRQQKIEFIPECLALSCHYVTGCFVAFLGDISTLKSGWNIKKIFCCPAVELFHCPSQWKTVLFVSSRAFLLSPPLFRCLPLWKTVRLHGKKLQNATKKLLDHFLGAKK